MEVDSSFGAAWAAMCGSMPSERDCSVVGHMQYLGLEVICCRRCKLQGESRRVQEPWSVFTARMEFFEFSYIGCVGKGGSPSRDVVYLQVPEGCSTRPRSAVGVR